LKKKDLEVMKIAITYLGEIENRNSGRETLSKRIRKQLKRIDGCHRERAQLDEPPTKAQRKKRCKND
jgi:hypothetical protein